MLNYQNYRTTSDLNWFDDDPILQHYLGRYVSKPVLDYVQPRLHEMGRLAAGPMDKRAAYTDRDGAPKLIRYNRTGLEINEIWYNEGYSKTVREGYGTGVVSLRYDKNAPEKVPFWINSVLLYLIAQAESGFACPVTLTQSVAFTLEKFASDELKEKYLTRLTSPDPDFFFQGATYLTEIQGGSDVGSTKTVAVKEGDHYRLTGEKWFASNCDAEVSITLARVSDLPSTKGLGLFLMPRTLPDGTPNSISIRRLKDKLGVRAVASGELVLNGAVGYLIGDAEHGFKYMAEALNVSRLDTALGGLGIAHRAYLEAMLYAQERVAFKEPIVQFPMIRETLVDMMTEIEAGWALMAHTLNLFDRVHTFDQAADDTPKSRLRIFLSLLKYRLSELGVRTATRSMEMHGGNGYIEEYVTPRLVRDALVNPIWEGTANIQALEVMKNLNRTGVESLFADIHESLEKVDHPCLESEKADLLNHVESARGNIDRILQGNAYIQSAAAKRVTDVLYDICSSVCLLTEANQDLLLEQDARRHHVLKHWLSQTLNRGRDHGLTQFQPISDEVFTSITSFSPMKANTPIHH